MLFNIIENTFENTFEIKHNQRNLFLNEKTHD